MFGIDPEEAAAVRLFHKDGWTPPMPDTRPVGPDEHDDDVRWEEVVSRWSHHDQADEGDDQ